MHVTNKGCSILKYDAAQSGGRRQHFRRAQYLHLQPSRWRKLISFYETKWRHIPENLYLSIHFREKHKSRVWDTVDIFSRL
jgi:hypothetical protein